MMTKLEKILRIISVVISLLMNLIYNSIIWLLYEPFESAKEKINKTNSKELYTIEATKEYVDRGWGKSV